MPFVGSGGTVTLDAIGKMPTKPTRQLGRCLFILQGFQRDLCLELGRVLLAFRRL